MAASGLTNTLPRSSCGKCVQVLKELISGLQQDEDTTNGNANANSTDKHNKHTNANANAYEPPPLTLLRAIARSSQDHPWHDKWGQEKQQMNSERFRTTRTINTDTTNTNTNTNTTSMASSISHAISHATRGPDETAEKLLHAKQQQSQAHPQPQQQSYPKLTIEETEDGVKVTIPVETTAPVLMKKWTQLEDPLVEEQQQEQQPREEPTTSFQQDDDEEDPIDVDEPQDWMPLATSVRRDDETTAHQPHTASPQQHPNAATPSAPPTNPLTIEFKCRRCETSGPEAGARAFLMGPEPLSIVLCHNRIHSEPLEVEEILTHELVHLYDVQTLQLDLSDCETVAYSEVRAAREAECHRSVREAAAKAQQNAQTQTPNADGLVATVAKTWEERVYKPYCVKSIALGATQNMFPREGKSCLHKVWERAYGDHRPFGRNLAPPASNAPSKAASVARQQTTTQERPFDEHSGTIHGTSGK